MLRRRPGLALAAGVAVGASVANKKAVNAQQQQLAQQQQQAALAQANAEAAAAQEAARQAAQPAAVAYATTAYAQPQQQAYAQPQQQAYAQPQQQAYAQPQPTYAAPAQPTSAPSSAVGRQMLNEALAGDTSAEDLTALKKQLTVVQMMCDQAMGLYQQSMQLNQKAQRTNVTGAVLDRGIRGSNTLDHVMDAKRDAETKAAIAPAEKASAMLDDGFKKIPDALRLRYPSEMSKVGNVPTAKLAVGNFGRNLMMSAAFGQRGENVSDVMMMKKIKDNEESLQRCMAVVNEQRQLMQIVQARLDQDIANTQRNAGRTQTTTAATAAPALMPPPTATIPSLPPAITPQNQVELMSPHLVDESNPAIQQHQIISVPAGATVKLVRGTLQGGLGAPYADYIEVEYNGRIGKISRLICRPASTGVPAALGIPPALY